MRFTEKPKKNGLETRLNNNLGIALLNVRQIHQNL